MKSFLLAVWIGFGLGSPGVAQEIADYHLESESIFYTVQLGIFENHGEAYALKGKLDRQGYSPVVVAPRGDQQAVCFGKFGNYPEAWIQRIAFRDQDDEAVVALIEEPVLQESLDGEFPAGPAKSVFNLTSGSLLGAMPRSMAGNPVYERLEPLDRWGNEGEYERQLVSALNDCESDDPLLGYITANIGALKLKEARREDAQELFGKVAKGEVPSSANVRLMAMRRYAWVTHQLGDRLTAYTAYSEIEQQTVAESVLAVCLVEKQGLLFELAESGKGSHEEVRRSLSEAWNRLPGQFTTHKATLELMFLETYSRQPQPDYLKAATMAEQFVERWNALDDKKPVREIGSAMHQCGMYWRKAGNDEKALYWAERTLNEIPATAPKFAGFSPHAEALVGIAKLLRGEENKSRRDQIRRDVIEWYPKDHVTSKIRALEPDLEQRVQPTLPKESN